MKLADEFEVSQPIIEVWSFFEKPEAVAGCVPGIEELTVISPDEIDVRLTQSIGPMTATFAAKVKIVERVDQKLIGFVATGKSVRGAMGNVRCNVSVQLESLGDNRTAVVVEGEVALAGALGSVGQKVVAKQSAKVTGQFARNLEVALGGDHPAVDQGVSGTTTRRPASTPRSSLVGDQHVVDPWSKVAAALSAISIVLGIIALRRRGCGSVHR